MKMKQKAFTLIELLVVITIITLLISILLPALSAARNAARNIQNESNMRQIGIAFAAYGSDHNGHIAYTVDPDNTNVTWTDSLDSYLGGNLTTTEKQASQAPKNKKLNVLIDPSDPVPIVGWAASYAARCSYSMPFSEDTVSGGRENFGVGVIPEGVYGNMPMANNGQRSFYMVKTASNTFMLMEMFSNQNFQGRSNNAWWNPWRGYQGPAPYNHDTTGPHQNKWDWLYVDGHVNMMNLKQTGWTPTHGRANGPWTMNNRSG